MRLRKIIRLCVCFDKLYFRWKFRGNVESHFIDIRRTLVWRRFQSSIRDFCGTQQWKLSSYHVMSSYNNSAAIEMNHQGNDNCDNNLSLKSFNQNYRFLSIVFNVRSMFYYIISRKQTIISSRNPQRSLLLHSWIVDRLDKRLEKAKPNSVRNLSKISCSFLLDKMARRNVSRRQWVARGNNQNGPIGISATNTALRRLYCQLYPASPRMHRTIEISNFKIIFRRYRPMYFAANRIVPCHHSRWPHTICFSIRPKHLQTMDSPHPQHSSICRLPDRNAALSNSFLYSVSSRRPRKCSHSQQIPYMNDVDAASVPMLPIRPIACLNWNETEQIEYARAIDQGLHHYTVHNLWLPCHWSHRIHRWIHRWESVGQRLVRFSCRRESNRFSFRSQTR